MPISLFEPSIELSGTLEADGSVSWRGVTYTETGSRPTTTTKIKALKITYADEFREAENNMRAYEATKAAKNNPQ